MHNAVNDDFGVIFFNGLFDLLGWVGIKKGYSQVNKICGGA
jgi:hypothetical protein